MLPTVMRILVVITVLALAETTLINEIAYQFEKVTNFALAYPETANFDALLGFVIAEGQLGNGNFTHLRRKCTELRHRIAPMLPTSPPKMPILQKYLLVPENWQTNIRFANNNLINWGIYPNWTKADLLKDKEATYHGIPTDYCLLEILTKNCQIGTICKQMMLTNRIDRGYLLTHRLFYLQIARLKQCKFDQLAFRAFTINLCSWIWREFQTNAHWDFPAHDIALEQMVLCGIEGYGEFFNDKWQREILQWQTEAGCYKSTNLAKRTSNIIEFGCSDHTTGLGAAALALMLKFDTQNLNDFKVQH